MSILPDNHYMYWGPASQGMAKHHLLTGSRKYIYIFHSLLLHSLCLIFPSFFSLKLNYLKLWLFFFPSYFLLPLFFWGGRLKERLCWSLAAQQVKLLHCDTWHSGMLDTYMYSSRCNELPFPFSACLRKGSICFPHNPVRMSNQPAEKEVIYQVQTTKGRRRTFHLNRKPLITTVMSLSIQTYQLLMFFVINIFFNKEIQS